MMPKAAMIAASNMGKRWSSAPSASIAIMEFHKARKSSAFLAVSQQAP